MERTLVLVKPDAIQRSLIGEIISRLEKKGLTLIGIKMIKLNEKDLKIHYAHLYDKPYFKRIKDYMISAPTIALCWEGLDCVDTVRMLCGITKAREATPGTIRGDLAMSIQCNLVHASDSIEKAKEEIKRFFNSDELFTYKKIDFHYIYSTDEIK